MGGVVSAGVDNDELVDKLKEADYIKSTEVEKVFRLVDRGYYLTQECQNVAYRDNAWKNGNLHISAPCIYAQVMEGLEFGAGMSFLNIGSGTGYLSTMVGLIVGPFGVNHGIELHSSVVAYARDRLSWFLANVGAIDVSFFCEPQFSQGNALCFKEDILQYDRVYCGASCPQSHENYMKNLIKVNGILVMPRNDKLVKITRTGDNTWNTESLIPVSFSSLVMPDQNITQYNATLPPLRIPTLQEISRELIRFRFRSIIESENKDLLDAFVHTIPPQSSRVSKPRCRPSRTFPHVTISDSEYETEASDGDSERDSIFYTTRRLHANQLSAFLELAQTLAMSRRNQDAENPQSGDDDEFRLMSDSSEDEMVEGDRTGNPEENVNEPTNNIESQIDNSCSFSVQIPSTLPKNENNDKVQSQIGPIKEEEREEEFSEDTPVQSPQRESEMDIIKLDDVAESDSRSSCSNSQMEADNLALPEFEQSSCALSNEDGQESVDAKKREKFDSGIVEDLGNDMSVDEEDFSSCSSESVSNESSDSCNENDQKTRSLPNHSDPESASNVNSNGNPRKIRASKKCRKRREISKRKRTIQNKNESRIDSTPLTHKYTSMMVERINKLPLPSPLKLFVNFNRPL